MSQAHLGRVPNGIPEHRFKTDQEVAGLSRGYRGDFVRKIWISVRKVVRKLDPFLAPPGDAAAEQKVINTM